MTQEAERFVWRSSMRGRVPCLPVPVMGAGTWARFRSAPSFETCVLRWFDAGFDSEFIALFLQRPPSVVANVLAFARDARQAIRPVTHRASQ